MDFGEVLGSAWKIIWKHKILWVFGIFAGCSRGGGGGGGGRGGGGVTTPPGGNISPYQYQLTQFTDWIQSHPWVVVLFVLVVLLIVILALLLGTMGRIGLIRGTLKADSGVEHLGFAELWDESRRYFWRVLLLSILIFVAFLVVLVPLFILGIGFTAVTMGLGLLCLIPLLCLLVPALALLGIVIQQAESAIVIEDLGVTAGLQRGWDVFRQHLGPMLLMWLILAVIGVAVGFVLAIPILVTVIPAAFALAGMESSGASFAPNSLLVLAAVCFCVYLPFLIVLNGILMSYLQSAWTLTYLRLTRPKSQPLVESPAITAPNA